MRSGIYKIENKVNSKVYIGSSNNIKRRWQKHKALLRHNKHQNSHLQAAWNKYGEDNFAFSIVELCPIDNLISREQYFIDSMNPEYNQSKIAGKIEMTNDIRQKLSCSTKNAYREGKLKETNKEIFQYDLKGNFIRSFNSLKEATECANVDVHHLSQVLNGKRNVAGGHVWRFYKVEKLDVWFNSRGRALTREPYKPKKKYNKIKK